MALALDHSPQLRASAHVVAAAEAGESQAAGRVGPSLAVDGGVQLWDRAIVTSFGDIPGFDVGGAASFEVRPAVTWAVNVTIAQPLTQLWALFTVKEIESLGVDVAKLQLEARRRSVALDTTITWLQAAAEREAVAVQQASVNARTQDLERVKALADGGAAQKSDVLRAELGVADARQQLISAQWRERAALQKLNMLTGAAVAPTPLRATLAADAALDDPAQGIDRARADRLELRELRLRRRQSDKAIDVATSDLLPQVSLVGAAQFANASDLQGSDNYFVGLNLSWTLWNWGSNYAAIDKARSQTLEIDARLAQLDEGIALEVKLAHGAAETARSRIPVAAQAMAQAEENYRLVKARQEVGRATAFDVLDAEASLTRARIDHRGSVVGFYVARAQLSYALGADPDAIAAGGTP